MEIKVLANKQENLIFQRNLFAVVVICVLIANLILAICLLTQKKQTILLPANLQQEVTLESTNLSNSYLEEMSTFFLSMLLNLTSSNIDYQSAIVLRHTHPSYYKDMQDFFLEEKQRYLQYKLSTWFVPSHYEIGKNLSAKVTGTLISKYSNTGEDQQNLTYQIDYGYSGGRLSIKSFTIYKNHAADKNDKA